MSNTAVNILEMRPSIIAHCQKIQVRSYSETNKTDILSHMNHMRLGRVRGVLCVVSLILVLYCIFGILTSTSCLLHTIVINIQQTKVMIVVYGCDIIIVYYDLCVS